jgi:hypothetical protein
MLQNECQNNAEDKTEEFIVGYDAREYWRKSDPAWTQERKQAFLYRLDVLKTLSVDTRVWPSIFQAEQRPLPANRSGFQDSWSDLAALQRGVALAFQEKPMRAWRMVAITLLLGNYCRHDDVPWSSRLPLAMPCERGAAWQFLGYDVGDQWLLSALSNCGFVPGLDDVPRFRNAWAPRLNPFHLFSDFQDALLFKRFSDQRLHDDHAPCFVFGLWIVK